ncbi:uncharacterized protein LOC114516131 [Dendronephthya gigantea]|uniref:uncharacterized protein LOC114516131 n=1 Tax=Dendronephthya gigantea TaxID=151771 RepID=UPI0010690FAC|nr:uncharacterized protein LOC114516131 [Dendronephthya gigantea]
MMNLRVVRSLLVTTAFSWVQFPEQNEVIQVPMNGSCSLETQDVQGMMVEDYTVYLQDILDMCRDQTGSTMIKLFLRFDQLENPCFEVCDVEIKELKVVVEVDEEEYKDGETIGTRMKKQMVSGPHKGRCQRLETKELQFSVTTNLELNAMYLRGYVKRLNDRAMLGKTKAVTGEIEVPLKFESSPQNVNNSHDTSYIYKIEANLDPDEFYNENPGKELYTSDKTTPANNIFNFGINICVGRRSFAKDVYRFKTKSKEYTPNSHKYIHAMELEATRAQIKDLRIQKLTTNRGDIAYSWQLQDDDSAARYEEGDVVGIFPSKIRSNDQTYLDLLTPENYKEAILAGVITRSYYIAANSKEDENPSEKICMVGKIPIKVLGPVKHGDHIYASNKLPGVGVTEEQLCIDTNGGRGKRLLGYSLETSEKDSVKLVSCIVSILLSIKNDEVEGLLARMEETLSENFVRRIDEFRDDVDIKMDGMTQIVSSTQDYVATRRKEISRRNCRVCSVIIVFFILAILSSFFFLSPTSPYIEWKCHRGSLPGTIKFKIENRNDEKFVRMEGILFDVADLRHKIGVDFALKKNLTGSYYLNLRKCKRENLRKVLGWFSNPPVYCRTQVFVASCNCSEIFHYHLQYKSWVKYDPVISPSCHGEKDNACRGNLRDYE